MPASHNTASDLANSIRQMAAAGEKNKKAIAKRLGCSRAYVSIILNAKVRPVIAKAMADRESAPITLPRLRFMEGM